MKVFPIISAFSCLLVFGVYGQSEKATTDSESVIEIGQKYTIQSRILPEPIDLILHLPDDYHAQSNKSSYPVLYLLGSNYRSRFAMTASTLDYMHVQGQIPGIILVGMDLPHGNFGLVPREDSTSADQYKAALKEEIFPFIDRTFRTHDYRILYGASNSGIFALYAMLDQGFPVDAFVASSPMMGWSKDLMMNLARDSFADSERNKRHLFLIESDDDFSRVTEHFPTLVELLERSSPAWLKWNAEIVVNSGHVPEVDLPLGLRSIFPDYNPIQKLETLQSLIDHYAELTHRYGFQIDIPPFLLFDLGFDLALADALEESQRIFEFAVKHHSKEARSFAGLGLVQHRKGDTEKAVAFYKMALEIDPKQGLARRMLDQIQKEAPDQH